VKHIPLACSDARVIDCKWACTAIPSVEDVVACCLCHPNVERHNLHCNVDDEEYVQLTLYNKASRSSDQGLFYSGMSRERAARGLRFMSCGVVSLVNFLWKSSQRDLQRGCCEPSR